MIATVAQESMTLDLLIWRVFGRQDERLVEQTLDLNQGLADRGAVLPVGLDVTLPEPATAQPARRAAVKLWD